MRLIATLRSFRETFDFGGRDVASWFPRHMAKGVRQMKSILHKVDCVVEVHDARIHIPLSGRNLPLQEDLSVRPHLLVLNKMDLADMTQKQRVLQELEKRGVSNVLFTNCADETSVSLRKVVPRVSNLIELSPRFNRVEEKDYSLMVMGIPNVGKSSFINALRRLHLKRGKASKVGGEPGITKAVLTRIQVCQQPQIYLLDTPGVMSPRIKNVEVGMKLALCGVGTILDHLVGEDAIADYLLFSLNKHQLFGYVEHYGLGEPQDDLQTVLKHIAVKLHKTRRMKALTGVGNITITVPNYSLAAFNFIRAFRNGLLGRITLD
uniref:Mitochondrial GTPase 1 n=1 Tax=Petromyzon marinus TaxID=7757 RepID=S4RIW9_PETMA